MTELDKLKAHLPFDFSDPEVDALKLHAVNGCQKLNAIPVTDGAAREAAIRELFGSVGENPAVLPSFICDNGRNIHVGDNFLANYNVTILDVDEVRIGNHVMIGPNTLISTVNHPLTPMGRRKHLSMIKPVMIGNDVWIGGNVTILPGGLSAVMSSLRREQWSPRMCRTTPWWVVFRRNLSRHWKMISNK